MVLDEETLFSIIKHLMFENTVGRLPELKYVKPNPTQLKITNGKCIQYIRYFSLHYGTVQIYDIQFFTKMNSKDQTRNIYQHKITEYYNYHVEIDICNLIINYANFNLDNLGQKHICFTQT